MMYKLSKPNIKIDDFFDDLLANRQGFAGKFRVGRIKSIKSELIEKETHYTNFLAHENKNELHQIVPTQVIEIPRDTPVLQFFNFPNTIAKNKLLEKLREYKLIDFIDSTQSKNLILEQLKEIKLNHLDDILTVGEDLYTYSKYVDKNVMKDAYEDYIVNDTGIGRDVYDELLLLADDAICPYCLIGNVTTLDHYLPKANYIDYAITPMNLIPSCVDCNSNKSDEIYDIEEKLLINSYIEDITSINWLEGELIEAFPITFKFKIKSNLGSSVLRSRLERQFFKLELDLRYGNTASRIFRIRVKSIVIDYLSGGLEAVRKKLESDKSSAEFFNLNSLEAKVYESLLNSNWFMRKDTFKSIIEYYKLEKIKS